MPGIIDARCKCLIDSVFLDLNGWALARGHISNVV